MATPPLKFKPARRRTPTLAFLAFLTRTQERDTMNTALGTYHRVPELVLFNEVMGYRGFLGRDVLEKRLADLNRDLDIYTRFLDAGCPSPSPEWFNGDATKESALEAWDMIRQYCYVTEKALAFVDSEAGKRDAEYEVLRKELRYLQRTLDDIGDTCEPGNVSGILTAIRETKEKMEEMGAGEHSESWCLEGAPSMKNYMNYEVGEAWREIMESMGYTSAAALCYFEE